MFIFCYVYVLLCILCLIGKDIDRLIHITFKLNLRHNIHGIIYGNKLSSEN